VNLISLKPQNQTGGNGMKRQKKILSNGNGITLIALVISIIVILILAGVSISAIVGDNGIITKAQSATYAQSVAALEEYLNQYYVQYYEELNTQENKVIGLKQLRPGWFFQTNLGYIADSDGNALYLIKKSGLPDEIKNQLKGGDANGDDTNYSNYANLQDVYGVTSDLKVYYCSDGKATMIGLNADSLDKDNPNRTVLNNVTSGLGKVLSSYDEDGDGIISSQEVKAVKTLTIDNTSGITSLKDLENLTSLETLTLTSLTLDNLSGLESCSNLYYVFFKGCVIKDYTALNQLSNQLKYLYFYNIDDTELATACSTTTGIGGKDFTKLEYLAVVGNTSYICASNTPGTYSTSGYISSGRPSKTITSIEPFNNLSSVTKSKIKYLSLQNNRITSLSGISGFTSLSILRLEYNSLTNLSGVGSITSIVNLYADYNSLTALDTFSSNSLLANLTLVGNTNLSTLKGLQNCTSLKNLWAWNCNFGNNVDGSTKNSTNDALASLASKTLLNVVDLRNSTKIKWIDYLTSDTAIRYLYLDGCTGMDSTNFSNMRSIINNCTRVSYPSTYTIALIDNTLQKVSLKSITIKKSDFETLKNKTQITHLSLYNLNITNDDGTAMTDANLNTLYNDVLGTLTGVKYLQIYASSTSYSTSKLSNINFVTTNKMTRLRELDLRGTAVTNLSNLNNYATDMRTLIINNSGISLSDIQTTINNIYNNATEYSYYISGTNAGLLLYNSSLYQKLSGLTSIIGLKIYTASSTNASGTIDLTGCTSLVHLIRI
jgi:type II secretory pathway pseudopilin PulG